MAQTIARIYGSQNNANAAAKELQDRGFSADSVHVIGQPSQAATETATDTSADATLASIQQTGIPSEHASVYADQIRQGKVLVAVYPPFGFAYTATSILDSHDPVPVDLPPVAFVPSYNKARGSIAANTRGSIDASTWDSAAPLSSTLGLRVLSDDPAPLSNYFKWRTIKPEPATSATLDKIRKQSDDAAPLSAKIGMRVLSDDPTPLSTKVGMAVLLDNPTPLSSKAGWRVLSDKAAPLSEKLGWRTLLDNPAPLSTKLGWRLLLDNPTPLSSWLGWSVLSKR